MSSIRYPFAMNTSKTSFTKSIQTAPMKQLTNEQQIVDVRLIYTFTPRRFHRTVEAKESVLSFNENPYLKLSVKNTKMPSTQIDTAN
ncbi:hypothetical protein M514_04762, partial [Trichuris suis]|uniref:Uncharacterized protein n=1 Tax=Trichuris suis TaxID=68888 RepID=A0A085MB23_9BILA